SEPILGWLLLEPNNSVDNNRLTPVQKRWKTRGITDLCISHHSIHCISPGNRQPWHRFPTELPLTVGSQIEPLGWVIHRKGWHYIQQLHLSSFNLLILLSISSIQCWLEIDPRPRLLYNRRSLKR